MQTLVQFDESELSDAVQWLSDQSIITKSTSSSSLRRLVPGLAYKLNEQVMSVLGGILPGKIVSHAQSYLQELDADLDSGAVEVPVFSSPGEMVVLTPLLLSNSVQVEFEIPDEAAGDSSRENLAISVKLMVSRSDCSNNILKRTENDVENAPKRSRLEHSPESDSLIMSNDYRQICIELNITSDFINKFEHGCRSSTGRNTAVISRN